MLPRLTKRLLDIFSSCQVWYMRMFKGPDRWGRNPAVLGSIHALATDIVFVWVPVWTHYKFPTMPYK